MPSPVGFVYRLISNLAAKIVYSTVEGYAFLFSRYGASVMLAGQALILLQTAGPKRVIAAGIKAATACVVGRSIWAFVQASRAIDNGTEQEHGTSASASAAATAAAQNAAAAVAAAAEATKSIWDWEPPQDDQFASGAWFVLRELARTAEEVRAQNPEVDEIMGRDEMSPTELASRLYYFYCAEEDAGLSAYDLEGASEVPDTLLSMLCLKRPLATFAYDCTTDAELGPALEDKGYRLLAAQYVPDFDLGCPAYYLALSTPGTNASSPSAKQEKEVLLCVRGTYSPEDVFTDLIAVGITYADGFVPGHTCHVHAGMGKAALALARKFEVLLCSLRDAGHTVTLVGHSLGAGVCSLLAVHLRQKGFTHENLRCFAYEPPACMDLPLAEACADIVTCTVHADDCVPRLAMGPFLQFLHELAEFDWRKAAETDGMPAALSVMHHLAGLFGAKEATEAAKRGEEKAEAAAAVAKVAEGMSKEVAGSSPAPNAPLLPGDGSQEEGEAPLEISNAPKYNPYPPGKIVFVALPPGELDASKAVRALVEPSHPVVRRLRLTSRMIPDHFIDKPAFLTALGETVTAMELKE